MSHASIPADVRKERGLVEDLIRLSVSGLSEGGRVVQEQGVSKQKGRVRVGGRGLEFPFSAAGRDMCWTVLFVEVRRGNKGLGLRVWGLLGCMHT